MVLKTKLLFFLVFFTCLTGNTQSSLYKSTNDQLTVPSPTAYSISLYGSKDVNYYTGTVPVVIPLANLSHEDITVPLSLSGAARAIKPNEIPSWVGGGWSLQVGGVISRNTVEMPDDLHVENMNVGYLHNLSTAMAFKNALQGSAASVDNYNEGIFNGQLDVQPDEFTFNFMGHSGSFFFDYTGQIRLKSFENLKITYKINPFSYSNDLPKLYNFLEEFTIITPDGLKYEFKDLEVSEQDFTVKGVTDGSEIPFVSSWYLSKVTSPNGPSVSFYYSALNKQTYRRMYSYFDKKWKYSSQGDPNSVNIYPNGNANSSAQYFTVYPIYLSSIVSDNFSATFITSLRNDLLENPNNISPASPSHTEKKLDEIIIKNGASETIKKINFIYSATQTTRLRLNEVKESDKPSYKFYYNGESTLPYATRNIDHWGYANGSNNTTLIPAVTFPSYSGSSTSQTITIGNANRSPSFAPALIGSLQKVVYPTGGYTTFDYEQNTYSYLNENQLPDGDKVGGGLRVKIIKDYDGVNSSPSNIRELQYNFGLGTNSSGVIGSEPVYKITILNGSYSHAFAEGITWVQGSSIFSQSISSGSQIVYKRVTEVNSGNGRTQLSFTTFSDYKDGTPVYSFPVNPLSLDGAVLQLAPYTDMDKFRGLQTEKLVYKEYATMPLTKLTTQYSPSPADITNNIGVNSYKDTYYSFTPVPMTLSQTGTYWFGIVMGYSLRSDWVVKKMDVEEQFSDVSISIQNSTEYFYDNTTHGQLTRKKQYNSKNQVVEFTYKYPGDVITNPSLSTSEELVVANLISSNQFNKIIEETQTVGSVQVSRMRAFYNTNPFYLKEVKTEKGTTGLRTEFQVTAADNVGNILAIKGTDGLQKSFMRNPIDKSISASVINALPEAIFFDSFEDSYAWMGITRDNLRYHCGQYAGKIEKFSPGRLSFYNSKILQINLSEPTTYYYSAWVYSDGPSADINVLMKTSSETGEYTLKANTTSVEVNKWVLVEGQVSVPANISRLSLRIDNNGGGNVWFDDIRLYPAAAQMVTYTYRPLVGLSSTTDVNNRSTFYEYDAANRLRLVRDNNRNILRKYCYNYFGEVSNCGEFDSSPQWENTGDVRCKRCPSNSLYYTGTLEYKQVDVNPNSSSNPRERWIDGAASVNCTVDVWQNSSAPVRCRQNQYGNTGEIEQEQINLNPCGTAATRWIVIGTNSATCPLACVNCPTVEGEKCFNGVCEMGIKVFTESIYDGGAWICIYHYEYSDGSWSQDYSTMSGTNCMIQ